MALSLKELMAAKAAKKAAEAAISTPATTIAATPSTIETAPATVAEIAVQQPEATLAEVETMVAEALPAEDRIETIETVVEEPTEEASEPVAVVGENGADEVVTFPEYRVTLKELWAPVYSKFAGKTLVIPSEDNFARDAANSSSQEAKAKGLTGGPKLNKRREYYSKTVSKIREMAQTHGYVIEGETSAVEVAVAPTPFSAPVAPAPVETTNTSVATPSPVAPQVAQTTDNTVETSGIETTSDAAPVVAAQPAIAEPVSAPVAATTAEPASSFVEPTAAKAGDKIDLSKIPADVRKDHAGKQNKKDKTPVIRDLADLAPEKKQNNGGLPPNSFVSKPGEAFFAVWDERPVYDRNSGLPEYCLLQVMNVEGKSQQIGFHPGDIRKANLNNFHLPTTGGDLRIPMVMEAFGFHKDRSLGHNIDFTKDIKWHEAIWMSKESAAELMTLQELVGTPTFRMVAKNGNDVCFIKS